MSSSDYYTSNKENHNQKKFAPEKNNRDSSANQSNFWNSGHKGIKKL